MIWPQSHTHVAIAASMALAGAEGDQLGISPISAQRYKIILITLTFRWRGCRFERNQVGLCGSLFGPVRNYWGRTFCHWWRGLGNGCKSRFHSFTSCCSIQFIYDLLLFNLVDDMDCQSEYGVDWPMIRCFDVCRRVAFIIKL